MTRSSTGLAARTTWYTQLVKYLLKTYVVDINILKNVIESSANRYLDVGVFPSEDEHKRQTANG